MPHVVIQYTQNLEAQVDMPALCRDVADTLIELRDEKGGPLYPVGGTGCWPTRPSLRGGRRQGATTAFATSTSASPPGAAMRRRRSRRRGAGKRCRPALPSAFEKKHVRCTLQIDESPGQVYDAKHSNLHPLFNK
jgi:5-carboxymethyl-2-hydroxymuconate isomerase